MMVQGLSATVNLFQCPNPDKAQAMCSRTDGDTTVVEKPYPDGPGYYCSSNIKDASHNCCNLDFKIGATYPGISKTIQKSSFSQNCNMVLQRNVSLNHLDRAKSLVQPEEMQHKIDFDLVKPFPSGSSYFCPADLLFQCLHSGLGGGLARRIVNPEAKPNKWPTASKSTFQLRFLVTMASSTSFPAAAPTDGAS
ncbi:hypothetical protein PSTG_16929 [Puccinia striiformis f. sp. tritici PST-78]|uniref:Uncharacterized protein n=1 Tax=Puccinia striiformis f. sp. tritici PST-78 TaxID=1165861 RepID=A0A0L0URB7_9BASI|nr:hypothetical protein PSTG_16929 [Puccinia striiformis f. sp. tritici PST-78]